MGETKKYCICHSKVNEKIDRKLKIDDSIQFAGTSNPVGDFMENVSYNQDNNFIKSILWGAKWKNLPNNELTWTINYAGAKTNVDVGTNLPLIDPTVATKNSVRTCMNDLSKIINLNIKEVSDINSAILSFNFIPYESVDYLGFASPPIPTNDPYYSIDKNYQLLTDSIYCPGNIFIAYNTAMNFNPGSYNYITLVHELGHAIGLAHPHDNGGNSQVFDGVNTSIDFGNYDANLQPLTIMTYNDIRSPYVPNSAINYGFLKTFGPIDIVALQYMYGKATTNSSNTTYKIPVNTTNSLGNFWETIFDSDGIDTIDGASISFDLTIDLNDATVADNTLLAGTALTSDTKIINKQTVSNNLYGGFTIAQGVKIENAITGKGNDNVIGNELNNNITITEGGSDNIDGRSGFDTVIINNNSSNFNIEKINDVVKIRYKSNSNVITLVNCEKIEFTNETILISEIGINDYDLFKNVVEYGTIEIDHRWKTINLSKSFSNPIVIVSDPTYRGKDACVVRIKSVSSTSFSLKLQEPRFNYDGKHTKEQIFYMLANKGIYTLKNKFLM